jgi:hypothetical protein
MLRIVKFTKIWKSHFSKQYRIKNKLSRYVALLHSPMFYIFGKNHCWVNIKYNWRYFNWLHIIRWKIIKYDKWYKINILDIII